MFGSTASSYPWLDMRADFAKSVFEILFEQVTIEMKCSFIIEDFICCSNFLIYNIIRKDYYLIFFSKWDHSISKQAINIDQNYHHNNDDPIINTGFFHPSFHESNTKEDESIEVNIDFEGYELLIDKIKSRILCNSKY